MDLMKRFVDFVKNLSGKDKIAVYHHSDPDGLCSGVIAARAIEKIIGKKVFHITSKHSIVEITPIVIAKLKKNKINKLVCTDLVVDENPATVKEVEKFAEILVLDHHKIYANLSSDKTIFIKSSMIEQRYCPASKLVFDLFSKVIDISDLDWLAAAGTIADAGYKDWKDFVDNVAKKYKYKIKGNIFLSEFYANFKGISYSEALGKEDECFEVLYETKKLADLKSQLSKFCIVEDEIEKYVNAFDKNSETFGDLVFYEFKPKYKIKSNVINIISSKLPNKTLIFIAPEGKAYAISARRGDKKVAVNDLLTEAVKGLEGAVAGGHVPAAGGLIGKADLKKFKENILKIYKKRF